MNYEIDIGSQSLKTIEIEKDHIEKLMEKLVILATKIFRIYP